MRENTLLFVTAMLYGLSIRKNDAAVYGHSSYLLHFEFVSLKGHRLNFILVFLCFKVQVDPGPEKTKHADKDENENKVKNKNCSSVPSGPQHTSAPVQSSDSSSDEEDDEEEESTIEPEVGNMT